MCGRIRQSRLFQNRLILAICLLGALSCIPVRAASDRDGYLYAITWQVTVWHRQFGGVACWLGGPAGEVRAEIVRGDPGDSLSPGRLAALLERRGEGWTVAWSGQENATVQPWGDRWREAQPPLTRWLRVLRTLAQQGLELDPMSLVPLVRPLHTPTAIFGRPRWQMAGQGRSRAETLQRLEFPGVRLVSEFAVDLSEWPERTSRFRQEMGRRGLGRGGGGEIWTLGPVDASNPNSGGCSIVSSRRAGRLELSQARCWRILYPDPEAFLTLWSLDELITGPAGGPIPCERSRE